MNCKYLPTPWTQWMPTEVFDWSTGGRALSEEEREHLRKVMLLDKVNVEVRPAQLREQTPEELV